MRTKRLQQSQPQLQREALQPMSSLLQAKCQQQASSELEGTRKTDDLSPKETSFRSNLTVVPVTSSKFIVQTKRATDTTKDKSVKPIQPQVSNKQDNNRTGIPNQLKSNLEQLSGFDLSNVRVHRNSDKPRQLNALAYAQGQNIYLAPGQEKQLPHEGWHVVQQMQGRVRPTMKMQGGAYVNNNEGLEKEANLMGARATQQSGLRQKELIRPQTRRKTPTTTNPQSAIKQLFSLPPLHPPAAGIRNHTLTVGVPTESHVTTIHGVPNDLVGAPPSATIHGWQHILNVGAGGPWVRFHLINQQVGGLGNQANLVPTSHATNHYGPWIGFETVIKNLVIAQTGIHATVDVTYPAAIGGAAPGTLASVSHYYPTNISARVYYWDPIGNSYVLHPNQPNFVPFPPQPPAVAGRTNLANQTPGWVRNTLMGGLINAQQATVFWNALQNGTADGYRNNSNEPTAEMSLLDALDEVGEVDCMIQGYTMRNRKRRRVILLPGSRVPQGSRMHILNGVYHLP